MARTRRQAAQEASATRDSLLEILAGLVFLCLPLSVQAITLPALSKAWKQWAREQELKERALEQAERQAERARFYKLSFAMFRVPLWAAQQRTLTDEQKQRFQQRAAAHGDVAAVNWFGLGELRWYHRTLGDLLRQSELCMSAARAGQLQALQWL